MNLLKWFIASDIHGSAHFAKKLITAYKSEQADKILLLGDILYHGPRNDLPQGYAPKEVIDLLNAEKERILCVRGNCDAEVDQMVLAFPIMDDFALVEDSGIVIFATHGHIYNEEKLPEGKFNVLLCGHTHIPKVTKHKDFVYINPGSVSIPKEGSHHGYMIYENEIFTWKDLDGNALKSYSVKEE